MNGDRDKIKAYYVISSPYFNISKDLFVAEFDNEKDIEGKVLECVLTGCLPDMIKDKYPEFSLIRDIKNDKETKDRLIIHEVIVMKDNEECNEASDIKTK